MNTWLLRKLNDKAKAWPYYASNRALQRRDIKENLRTLRKAVAAKGYAMRSHDGNCTLHYDSRAYVTNCTERDFTVWQRLGIPCIDCTTADLKQLMKVVVSGPMISLDPAEIERNKDWPRPFQYISLAEGVEAYRQAGATIYNA